MRKDLCLGCKAGSDSLNGNGTAAVQNTGEEQERPYSTCFPSPVLGQPDLCTSCTLRFLLTGAPQQSYGPVNQGLGWPFLISIPGLAFSWSVLEHCLGNAGKLPSGTVTGVLMGPGATVQTSLIS